MKTQKISKKQIAEWERNDAIKEDDLIEMTNNVRRMLNGIRSIANRWDRTLYR